MPKKKFADPQISFALQQAEAGTPIEKVRRKMGVSRAASTAGRRFMAG